MNLILTVLMLAAAPARGQERSTDTFVHLTSSQWLTMDPANASDAVSSILIGNVYESLVAFNGLDPRDGFKPFLASQVPTRENGLLAEDRRTYVFPIRKGVRFHDGGELTADDVRYSLLRYMLMDADGGPAALLLKPVLGVYGTRDSGGRIKVDFAQAAAAVQSDRDRVIIHLKEPDAAFLSLLASLPIVVSKAWARAHGEWDGTEETWKAMNNRAPQKSWLDEHMDGTGPFRLEKLDREGEEIVLARHEGYWRKPAALSRVVFKVAPSSEMRLFMLETGDADAAYLEDSYRDYLRGLKGVRVVEGTAERKLGETLFFTFKVDPAGNELLGSGTLDGSGIPPDFFSDLDVRRGFAYAFDYGRYLKDALGGRGVRTSGPFPPALVAPGPAVYSHDPQKAETAFRKAFGGAVWEKGFVLQIPSSANDELERSAAEIMKASLEKLNPKFKVRLFPMQNREFFRQLELKRLPFYVAYYYADYPDPHSFAFGMLHSQGYFPRYQGYASARADELVESAAKSPSPAERLALYRRLDALAAAEVPQIYTYAPRTFSVFRSEVKGFDAKGNENDLGFNGFPYFYSYSKTAR
ncbi:MAG: ABC transporter substrate-binding protein [Elusimicrobia bacterium]|nr:ABC transporter substrate-binding protein [Elusimicrobiota bacterium]